MKKVAFLLILVLLVIGLVACGPSPEQIVENMMQEAMNDESGNGDVDIDMDTDGDGGSLTISDGENEMVFEGDTDGIGWPDDMSGHVPQIPGVKVTGKMDSEMGLWIYFEGCDKGIADSYVTQLEGIGWESFMEMQEEGSFVIQFQKDEKEYLTFSWSSDDSTGALLYAADSES